MPTTQAQIEATPDSDAGCLALLALTAVSPVYGFVMQEVVVGILANSWTSCFGMAWQVTHDLADSPRIGLFGFAGYTVLYGACLPLGLLVASRVARRQRRMGRVAAALGLAAALTLGVFTADLMLHISAPYPAAWDGRPPVSHCVAGRPSWWPSWLPARAPAHPLPPPR